MKKYRLLLALACALVAMPYSWAQLVISNTQALAFGKFVAGSGGTITVGTNGARSRSGGVLLLSSEGGTAATFNITDTNPENANKIYIITLPDTGTVRLASGSNSIALDNFVSNPSGSSMLTGGTQILAVGATLTVGANQPVGSYSGNFSVIVDYQ